MSDVSRTTNPINLLPNAVKKNSKVFLALQSKGHYSVWHRVQGTVLVATIWATLVWGLSTLGLGIGAGGGASNLVGILSMVTGLMVSFRSGSSYDRWYEGRRLWATMQSTTRTTLRLLVFSKPTPSASNTAQIAAIDNLCAIVCAFSFATMEHLRDRPGVSSPQLRQLLPADLLESYSKTPESVRRRPRSLSSGPVQHSQATEAERAEAALNTKPTSLRLHPWALASGEPSNLPLSLIRVMHAYLNVFHSGELGTEGMVDPGPTWSSCLGSLKEFTDCLTALERVRDTPIPMILHTHLQILLFVYIAAVPLQLVKSMGIWAIPATSVACFVFFGVDAAGEELSDPFGTEPNDLPLDKFCAKIHREYLELTGTGLESGSAGNDFVPDVVGGDEKKRS